MRRREFIAGLGAAAWPARGPAQPAGKLPTIGFLGTDASLWSPWTAAFVERLRALGWIEGRNLAIEYRWAEGRPERIAEIAAEFVRLKVDVVFTYGDAVATAKQATGVVPVVFVLASDPVGSGLVPSLARPGGNVTGLSTQATDTAGKRLELVREVVRNLSRLAVLGNVGNPSAVLELGEVRAAARGLGIEVTSLEIARAEDIAPAFEKSHADALYVAVDALVAANSARIIALALSARLPTILNNHDLVRGGAFMSYAVSFPDHFRRGADLVDKILRGTKPGDIPVEQPTKFDLVVNLRTAKAIGLAFPETLLVRADEVIE